MNIAIYFSTALIKNVFLFSLKSRHKNLHIYLEKYNKVGIPKREISACEIPTSSFLAKYSHAYAHVRSAAGETGEFNMAVGLHQDRL